MRPAFPFEIIVY